MKWHISKPRGLNMWMVRNRVVSPHGFRIPIAWTFHTFEDALKFVSKELAKK